MNRTALKSKLGQWIALVTLVGWLIGPCKMGAVVLAAAVTWDGQHRTELSEDAKGFSIRLRHDRSLVNGCRCPKGHFHRGLIAWLVKNPNDASGNHPDHFIHWQGGQADAEKRIVNQTKAPGEDSLATPDLPVVAELIVPVAGRTITSSSGRPTHWPQAPPRTKVLLL